MCRVRAASTRLSSGTDRRTACALLAALAVSACQGTPRPASTPARPPASAPARLQRDIDAILASPVLARATWGILVRSAKTLDTLYALNDNKLLMPGSTMKIVTLAAAAERLGWDYVYETRLVTGGPIDSGTGVLDGDVFLAGSGDPTIVSDAGLTAAVFAEWAEALKARGIRTITGRIVGNDNAFDDEAHGPGWAWDDLAGRDATAVSALQYNENVVLATIVPGGAVGAPAVVTIVPAGSTLVVDDRIATAAPATPAAVTARRSPGSDRIELRGSVPIGGAPLVRSLSVDNPTMFFAAAVRHALTAAGIDVWGPPADIDDLVDRPAPPQWTVLATHRSRPLSGLAVRLMKNSQNLYADTLLKTLGATAGSPSFESGRIVATAALVPWGVDPSGLVQVDGSGLSRYNYVTPDTLVDILLHVHGDERFRSPFQESLAIAGRDGTLATRMKGTAAEGNVRAKSGTLANVRSLAGYVSTADGEPLVFAVIANNFGRMPEHAIAAIDAIAVKLAEFER